MDPEKTLGVVALAWLIGAFLMMARSVQRGRRLAESLEARHPALYESLGRPRPGYFESARRSRFARFVGRREFEELADPSLAARFEEHRRAENRSLLLLLTSLAALGLLILVAQHVA